MGYFSRLVQKVRQWLSSLAGNYNPLLGGLLGSYSHRHMSQNARHLQNYRSFPSKLRIGKKKLAALISPPGKPLNVIGRCIEY